MQPRRNETTSAHEYCGGPGVPDSECDGSVCDPSVAVGVVLNVALARAGYGSTPQRSASVCRPATRGPADVPYRLGVTGPLLESEYGVAWLYVCCSGAPRKPCCCVMAGVYAGRLSLRLWRRQKNTVTAAMMPSTASPPMTPPTIWPQVQRQSGRTEYCDAPRRCLRRLSCLHRT